MGATNPAHNRKIAGGSKNSSNGMSHYLQLQQAFLNKTA